MVARPKLILYAQRLKDCSCYRHIFDTEFEVDPTDSRNKFLRKTHQPIFDEPGKPAHEWLSFTEGYSVYGFGNPFEYSPFTIVLMAFLQDVPDGD